MSSDSPSFANATETGKIGIMHLKRYWSRAMISLAGTPTIIEGETDLDQALLNVLRLSVEPTINYLFSKKPTFPEFEQWILTTTGQQPNSVSIQAFNAVIQGVYEVPEYMQPTDNVLTQDEWDCWNQQGYLIIRNAVSKEDCRKTLDLIFEHLGVDESNPITWYQKHASKKGIMVQLFHDAILEKNRQSERIRQVYEQLWQRNDLLSFADRVSFNPPETLDYPFQGPDLHWDVSLKMPIPMGTQGILYLSDTAVNQGAFTLVPGFQHRIEDWIKSLPNGTDPRMQDLHALGSVPLAANAGDFIVWNHALPHGSSPNTATVPRIVQYINYQPMRVEIHDEWI